MYTTPAKCEEVIAYLKKWSNNLYHLHQTSQFLIWGFPNQLSTLVCWIDVHAHLLILRKNFPLHGLIWVCTFIDFEKKFPPARLFHPACLLVLVFVVIIHFLMVKSQINWILVKWQCLVKRTRKTQKPSYVWGINLYL